jgi:hypothetical protein
MTVCFGITMEVNNLTKKKVPKKASGRKSIYDFGAIKDGHPLIVTDHNQAEVCSMLRYYKGRHEGEDFTTRRINGTIEVYRVAP